MESFTSEELKEAVEFAEFYFDLLEKHIESVPYYLSETVTLDWFGQTIRGQKNVGIFLKNHASSMKHLFDNPKPTRKIGHRDTHVIRRPRELRKRPISLLTPSVVTATATSEVEKTPPNNIASSSHHLIEQGQGDGVHNYSELPPSPAKRSRLGVALVPVASPEDEIVCSPVKFLSSVGHVEFHRRSVKKMQPETKWARPCKLEIGYSSTTITDATMHLIIYASNVKCRRNLLNEFERADAEDNLNSK